MRSFTLEFYPSYQLPAALQITNWEETYGIAYKVLSPQGQKYTRVLVIVKDYCTQPMISPEQAEEQWKGRIAQSGAHRTALSSSVTELSNAV